MTAPAFVDSKDGLRYAETVNAGIIVTIEEDGIGWRLRLQRRHWNACNVDHSCNSPTNVVEVQVRCGNIRGRANGDGDIVILESVRGRDYLKWRVQPTSASKAVGQDLDAEVDDVLGLADELELGTAIE